MTLQDLKERINTFSIAQMVSNADGKTSASATTGVIVSLIGVLCFTFGCVDRAWLSKSSDIMMYATGVITLGTSLLGVNKLSKGSSMADEAIKVSSISTKEDEPKP